MNNSKAATENLFPDYSAAIKVIPNKVKWQTHWLLEALSNCKRNSKAEAALQMHYIWLD